MSQLFENNEFGQEQILKHAFNGWDAGMPSDAVWDAIEEDLVIENTWAKLDEELSLERVWVKLDDELPHSPNASLSESYEDWEPEMNGNGWAKLDEELSRERVWVRLRNSLNKPVSVQMPILKMVAATILFISIAFYTDNGNRSTNIQNELKVASLTEHTSVITSNENSVANLAGNNGAEEAPKILKQPVLFAEEKIETVNPIVNLNNSTTNNEEDKKEEEKKSSALDLALTDLNFSLDKREVFNEEELLKTLYKKPRVILHPKWSLGIGSQLAIINEEKRSTLTSTLPRFGFAADAQYHLYFRDFRWSNGLGFAQYKQENGRYTNGRYLQSNQNLNTAYFTTSIGYNVQRFTFFGGIMVNKLLNGYEGTKSVTTNVYNSKHLQVGGKVGIDYNFKPFRNNTCLGLTMQYQFVPSLKSMNQTFNDIHGLGMQIKFSF